MKTKVLSLGGSIVAPEFPDAQFVAEFVLTVSAFLEKNEDSRLILVVGGGGPARIYQNALRKIVPNTTSDSADWVGIMATRLNAQFVKASFAELCTDDVVTDPTAQIDFRGRILVAAGWKPGFSTDNDAVLLAQKFGADTVVNLSNIEKVFTDDPKKNPDAKPLDKITWSDFRKMVGDEWNPGKNCPFDPIASRKAQELGLKVICALGRDIKNTLAILEERDFTGTTIC